MTRAPTKIEDIATDVLVQELRFYGATLIDPGKIIRAILRSMIGQITPAMVDAWSTSFPVDGDFTDAKGAATEWDSLLNAASPAEPNIVSVTMLDSGPISATLSDGTVISPLVPRRDPEPYCLAVGCTRRVEAGSNFCSDHKLGDDAP